MATWFEQNAVDLIGHALTVIGIAVAAWTVVWQIGRQHKSSLLLQRDNVREELKLRLHEMLSQKVRRLSDANLKAAMYVFHIPYGVESYQRQLVQVGQATPIKERIQEFSQLHFDASRALVELIQEFETWSIAFPGIEVFQVALNVANHDAKESFVPLSAALLRVLPIDPPENAPPNMPRPYVQRPISDEELKQLKKLVERYKEARDDIGSYVYDLTAESQNNLLSGLFDRRVPVRQPLDSKYKVLTTDPKKMKELLHYFEHGTAWGKAKIRTEESIRAEFASLNNSQERTE